MKARILLKVLAILFFLNIHSAIAQSPVHEWTKQISGSPVIQAMDIAVDTSGNAYTIGAFQGTADFDPGPETFNLTSAGTYDIYIQKLDAAGNFVWAKHFGSSLTLYDWGNSIAVDASGSVYVTGYFSGTVDFDPGSETNDLTSVGARDIFILKLDTDGNFLWAKQMGSSGYDQGSALTVDASGNVYTTGVFQQTVDFDPGEETFNLTSVGIGNVFVQKLNTYGNFIWAKQMGGANYSYGKAIAVDAYENVYIAGDFEGIADFDPGSETFNLNSFGNTDIFVQKLDPSGNFVWAKRMGGSQNDQVNSIAVDNVGNVYAIGTYESTAIFGFPMEQYYLSSVGEKDIYVQKIDTDGNTLWAKSIGGNGQDYGLSLTVDIYGEVYIAGGFSDIVDFDPSAEMFSLIAGGIIDIFIQKFDADGNFRWVKQMVGTYEAYGFSIAVDADLNVYTTGYFRGSVDFDPGLGTFMLNSTDVYDGFVQKLSPCYSTNAPIPNVAELPTLTPFCEVTVFDAPQPMASNDCEWTIAASANVLFPITSPSITEIVWTYDDGAGNVFTQIQPFNWVEMDITTSVDWLTITANNNNATYQWVDCDKYNVPLYGKTNQSFTASTNGSYAVEITENGCVKISECVSIISVGLREFDRNVSVAIYPNPSTGIFNIAFEKPIDHTVLTITDIQGKLISTTQIQNVSQASIELNEAPGVYLLTIKSKEGHKTIQLIKE